MKPLRDARTRILLYFFIGIALPSGLLGYLAFRGIQNDRALVERERRNQLQGLAAQFQASVAERLSSLTAAVSRVTGKQPAAANLRAILDDQPWLDAVFVLSPDSTVRVVAARGLHFVRAADPRARSASPGGRWSADFRAAEARELRARDLAGALVVYRDALAQAPDEQSRARALLAVARVQRKLGQLDGAARSYQRIGERHGEVRLPGGMLLGPAAGLELGTVLLEAGDSVTAGRVLLQHYVDLLNGRWALPQAQFDLVAGGVRESLTSLSLGDTLRSLRRAEVAYREHAAGLLDFEAAAERLLRSGSGAGGPLAVPGGPGTFHAVLLEAPAGAEGIRWGFSFDLKALASEVLTQLAESPASSRAAWVLLASPGDTLAASPRAAAVESPRVSDRVARYSPWSFELAIPAGTTHGGFLTSRRAVYFYAFVLLASILLFGLILTIRTVGRELELARLKSDFVSTVSHEFKSPLTAIRHLAEMLSAGRTISEERRLRYYQVLDEQSGRLALLVDNVLDLSRLEAGKRPLSLEPVELGGLIEQTATEVQQRVAHQGFRIRVERNGPLPVLRLDGDAVRQALGNLLDNAVKYSGSSREVVVKGLVSAERAGISVQDFGIGIEPHEIGRIFERFYRGGAELTRTVKGTGLGLALVKQITEAHGGVVEVASGPGQGSTFSLLFPLPPGAPRGGA